MYMKKRKKIRHPKKEKTEKEFFTDWLDVLHFDGFHQ